MKRIFLFACIGLALFGCKDKVSDDNDMNRYVNKWLYDNMDLLYYWNEELPDYKSSYSNPADYFETLINDEDRFSAIFESYEDIANRLNGVSAADVGFDFQLYRESSSNDNVIGVVNYVKKGTPAASLGVERGDWFTKINGKQLTITNYSELLNSFYDSTADVKITFALVGNGQITNLSPTTITKVVNYEEDPLYLDTVYTVQSKKIGYLVYNFFTNDSGDESMKYDLEINDAIGRFKGENISELVIDLRYNSGGMMSSAINIGSMLVPNLTTGKVFTYTEYNQNYTDYFNSSEYKNQSTDDPFVDNFATTITADYPAKQTYTVNNVGDKLQRIFFLTGSSTASASEMVINGLKPYINCVLIGGTTVGKNVGSVLVHDEDNTKNQWAFMPIVLKYFNKDHQSDFTNGFTPDFEIDDNYAYPLGDVREVLLAKAISQITGASQVQAAKARSFGAEVRSVGLRNKQPHGLVVKKKAIELYQQKSR
jgi:C-terminal processing protease CtpA/Prc